MNDINCNASINISPHRLQFLEVVKEQNKLKLTNINEIDFENPLNFDSQQENVISSHLQTALDKIKLDQPIKSRQISFTLPQESIFSVQLPFDTNLVRKELIEEFRWELSLLFPFVPGDDLVIQHIQLEKNFINKKHIALVMAIEKKYLMLLKNLCLKNKISLKFVDGAIVTTNRLINSFKQTEKEQFLLNVIVSGNNFVIIINENSKPAYVKSISQSGSDSIAEMINKELTSPPLSHLRNELLNEAYISGNDVSTEFVSQLRLTTGLNFIKINPFTNLMIEPGIKNQHLIEESYNAFTAAAGMAFRLA